jgi:hypothetical protein
MAVGRPERTAPMTCPGCGEMVTGRSQAPVNLPPDATDGDVSVCWYCSHLSIYVGTPPHALREPTEQELANLKADPGIRQTLSQLTLWRMANPHG